MTSPTSAAGDQPSNSGAQCTGPPTGPAATAHGGSAGETVAARQPRGPWRIGVDVGGTFTDLVLADAHGATWVAKVPSVPGDPSRGVHAALARVAVELGKPLGEVLAGCSLLVHGSTVATNTMLEGTGAKVGLIATEGFRDTLEIRRGLRDDQWNHRAPYAPVLVPRHLRATLSGRIDADGSEHAPLALDRLDAVLDHFDSHGVEAVAIAFINSFANDAHERAAAEAVADRWSSGWVTTSTSVSALMGEYERTSTAVVNATLSPKIVTYLHRLNDELAAAGLSHSMLLVQSNGGAASVEQVSQRPVHLLLSGPAAAVGALNLYRTAIDAAIHADEHTSAVAGNLISMEIGGTSCDVLLMSGGEVDTRDDIMVAGYHVSTPAIDIHTIGAGGGTIAGVDEAGLLYVGPRGAGATPGPACYGHGGTLPTVTDAQLVLGRLRPGKSASGTLDLDLAAAREAVRAHIAEPLGLSVDEAAAGIVEVVEQQLLGATEHISIERGHSPRRFTMVAAGGAGPMHGASVAAGLGCERVYVPRDAGALCAIGMLHADIRQDFTHVLIGSLDELSVAEIEAGFDVLRVRARREMDAEGIAADALQLDCELELHHPGQLWTIRVPAHGDGAAAVDAAAARAAFEAEYERLYGHVQQDGTIMVASLRLVARASTGGILAAAAAPALGHPEPVETRPVWHGPFGWRPTPVFDGATLRSGHSVIGPALVEEVTTTIVARPGDRLWVDKHGNLFIDLAPSGTIETSHTETSHTETSTTETSTTETTPTEKSTAEGETAERGSLPARSADTGPASTERAGTGPNNVSATPHGTAPLDPIVLAVMGNRLDQITKHMGWVMTRTARSTIFSQSHDFSCYVTTPDGTLVANADGIPIHTGGGGFAVRALLQRYGGRINPEDVFLLSDPYVAGGNHLPDWVIARPVFALGTGTLGTGTVRNAERTRRQDGTAPESCGGEHTLVGFCCNRAHQSDIGGGLAGTYNPEATEIWQEGIRLPVMKLTEAGAVRDDLWELLLINSRTPDLLDGDLRAMIGSTRIGAQRVLGLVAELGVEEYLSYLDGVLAHGESRMRSAIAALPDGTYHGEDRTDNDCFGPADIAVRVRLSVEGDEMTLDFTGTDPQIDGFKNSSLANTYSSVYLAVSSFFDTSIPRNEGTYRPLTIIAPPGSIVNALPPAPMTMNTVYVAHEIVIAVWQALAQTDPQRACAAWSKTMHGHVAGRRDDGTTWVMYQWHAMGTPGATAERDGFAQMGHLISLGGLDMPNLEFHEQMYPVRYVRHEQRCDNAGPGQRRGGTGVRYEADILEPAIWSFRAEGLDTPTGHGVRGGGTGRVGLEWIVPVDADADGPKFVPPKYGVKRLGPARMIAETPGGGGWGDAFARTPDAVLRDVMDELVSIEGARRDYGVVIARDGESVDAEATARLRAASRAGTRA
ncbi:hydantoinase B/oxoprolinase family protein [Candidatus Poriferisodalis sp.]|uniref:hydantoinase B/oxoprolinase family protein n=1 Tax=Candidatus Poriferisodalis sp. TaxID=3101277 RepID=UPI003B011977